MTAAEIKAIRTVKKFTLCCSHKNFQSFIENDLIPTSLQESFFGRRIMKYTHETKTIAIVNPIKVPEYNSLSNH